MTRVNRKNLAVSKLMARGKDADKRLKYLHVSPRGTTVVTPTYVAQVSLPAPVHMGEGPLEPLGVPTVVIPQDEIDRLRLKTAMAMEVVELPEGEPAVTGPNFLVPQVDKIFPDPMYTTAVFTCNADTLKRLLTVACEVSDDEDKIVRLRFCKDINALRIDAYRQPGEQEFCAAMTGMTYDGGYIPGEKDGVHALEERRPVQRAQVLKALTGRKFRGEGE